MSVPSNRQVLRLYKYLLKYGQQLKFTDKKYFAIRVKTEFKSNKELTEHKDILFNYQRGEQLLKNGRVL